ncbi:MAG: Hsp20/alpha crystallin family protein [Alphaproteobacteria bacterium]|nr:Hsp20/alpha crystallin family protein [Alphaproteobacteria bacterium]
MFGRELSPRPRRADLSHPIDSFQREVDALFDNFFRGWPTSTTAGPAALAAPKVDVSETAAAFVVTAEMPGLTEKDFAVEVVENVLTIKGEKKAEAEKAEGEYRWSERSYGRFERAFTLPPNVDADRAEAIYANGVLTLTLPKVIEPEKMPKKISVRSA